MSSLKQSWTGFMGAFTIIFCIVNPPKNFFKEDDQHFPNVFQFLLLWSIFEGMAFQEIPFGKSCPQHSSVLCNVITQVSTELKLQPSSLLTVDFISVALLFPTAVKSHIGPCYYVTSQVLKPVKYKLSALEALLAECHCSHHGCLDPFCIHTWFQSELNSIQRQEHAYSPASSSCENRISLPWSAWEIQLS